MDAQTFDSWVQLARTVFELAAATGVTTAAYTYLKSKGIDLQQLQNNKLVQAAERAAEAVASDMLLQGKSLKDPSVIADIGGAVRGVLVDTHATTIKAMGASTEDVARIAANAAKTADKVTAALTAPTVLPLQAATSVIEPIITVTQAAKIITDAQSALASAGIKTTTP